MDAIANAMGGRQFESHITMPVTVKTGSVYRTLATITAHVEKGGHYVLLVSEIEGKLVQVTWVTHKVNPTKVFVFEALSVFENMWTTICARANQLFAEDATVLTWTSMGQTGFVRQCLTNWRDEVKGWNGFPSQKEIDELNK